MVLCLPLRVRPLELKLKELKHLEVPSILFHSSVNLAVKSHSRYLGNSKRWVVISDNVMRAGLELPVVKVS